MAKTVTKITALKALLGDEAARKIVEEAETREKAAQAAGIEFKDADEQEPVALSALLAQIDEGIAAGKIVDDVNTEDEATAAPAAKEAAFTLDAFKSAVAEIVDGKLAAFKAELAGPENPEETRTKEAEELRTKLKTLEAESKQVNEKLAELLGEQPRSAAYRASRANDTVKEKDHVPAGPGPDPLNQFIDDVVFGVAKRDV